LLLNTLFNEHKTKLDKIIIGISFYVGCVIGCVWGGKHVSYGRRRAILFSSTLLIFVTLFMMIENYYVFVTGRFFIGLGTGIKLVAFLRMIEEYCPQSYFAMMANAIYACITLGAVLSAGFPIEV